MRVTHYQILGIQNDANQEDIRDAYKREALIWHPDKASGWAPAESLPDCEAIFKMIERANAVLLNNQTRMQYDLQLTLPEGVSPETSAEKEFAASWKKLKANYEIFKNRGNDPLAFIAYLQQKMKEEGGQAQLQKQRISKIEAQLQKLPQIIISSQKNLQAQLKASKE